MMNQQFIRRRRFVTLIGMPSAGKTKIGELLAKLLGWDFVDIDEWIAAKFGTTGLQEVVDTLSPEDFAMVEAAAAIMVVAPLSRPTIIATGGSMIYHENAMEFLHQQTHIIHLQASLETIERRVAKHPDRGIVFEPGETLADLYAKRMPRYASWAHETVNTDRNRRQVAKRLAAEFATEVLA